MFTVLIVDGSAEEFKLFQSDNMPASVQVQRAQSLEVARGFFNGSAGAEILVIAIAGAREFVLSLKRRFPKTQVIGLKENRTELCDCGCCCIVDQVTLPLTIPAILEKHWRFGSVS